MQSWLARRAPDPPCYPPLPAGRVIYAVGDLHGRADLLDRVHAAIDRRQAGRDETVREIYLGDYVDRGPDSAGVVERLIARAADHHLVALRGNHEEMFEEFLAGRIDVADWRRVGGLETLASYGVDVAALARAGAPSMMWSRAAERRVPDRHRAFLAALRDHWRDPAGWFFAHAGVRPGVALDAQAPDDLLWIRAPFLTDERDFGAVVVHGHTPMGQPEFRPNRINLDTGAYLTDQLTCLRIDHDGATCLEH